MTDDILWAEIRSHHQACRDPKDDKFMDVALTGNATGILTVVQDLLALRPFHVIKMISPAAY